jgi:hypothetical protein
MQETSIIPAVDGPLGRSAGVEVATGQRVSRPSLRPDAFADARSRICIALSLFVGVACGTAPPRPEAVDVPANSAPTSAPPPSDHAVGHALVSEVMSSGRNVTIELEGGRPVVKVDGVASFPAKGEGCPQLERCCRALGGGVDREAADAHLLTCGLAAAGYSCPEALKVVLAVLGEQNAAVPEECR